MSLITTRTARSVIYFVCIGGLLVLNSLVVLFIWNYLIPTLRIANYQFRISFLEGAGISAFTYVIAFSIRYGLQGERPLDFIRYGKKKQESERKREMKERCSHLTAEQREALKHELVTTCGCKEHNGSGINTEGNMDVSQVKEITVK